MDELQMDEIKGQLEEKKEELTNRLNALAADKDRSEKGAISADSDDQSQEVENNEVVDGLENLEAKELGLVNGALKRIDNGKFGNCLECGEQISAERLKALPYAPNCIGCSN